MEITRLHPGESEIFRETLQLFEEVFAEKHGTSLPSEYLEKLLRHDFFMTFVALEGDKVAGGLTAYLLPSYYSEKPFLYIFDLAVKGEFQRHGVGSQLLQAVLKYGREIGVAEAFVQADRQDIHAQNFYAKNGGTPEDVLHYTYPVEDSQRDN